MDNRFPIFDPQKITTLIFDFGGVLIDLDMNQVIESFKNLGVDVSPYLGHFGQNGFFMDLETGKIDETSFRNEVRKLTTNVITDEQIDDAWGGFLLDIPLEKLRLLQELKKNYRLLMLSNTNSIHITKHTPPRFAIDGKERDDYFDKCYLSYELGLVKPGREIFEYILNDSQLNPDECLFLDDGPSNIDEAQKLGIPGYWVSPRENLEFLRELKNPESYTATVGFFDGVHTGHQFLIDELKKTATSLGTKSMIITFRQHPRLVLHNTFQPKLLTSADEKAELLARTGVDRIEIIEFDESLSKLTALEFIKEILYKKYKVKALLVGHDHRFGYNRTESFPEYQAYGNRIGMKVIQAEKHSTEENKHISSSDIRTAIETGQVELANTLLGYPFCLKGKVVKGFQMGRKIGFPTANIQPSDADKMVPGLGVYAVKVEYQGITHYGMMNIGYRPTLENGTHTSLEVHIFDFDEDIYQKEISIRFIQKIRDEVKFAGLELLIQQLEQDKQNVKKLFKL